jgi:hypothetical protein
MPSPPYDPVGTLRSHLPYNEQLAEWSPEAGLLPDLELPLVKGVGPKVELVENYSIEIQSSISWDSIRLRTVKKWLAHRLLSLARVLRELGVGEVDFWPIVSYEELGLLEGEANIYKWTCVSFQPAISLAEANGIL